MSADHSARILGLASVASALSRADRLTTMLQLAAEEALDALGAQMVSISRVLPGAQRIRVLINVGAGVAAHEVWPQDEVYDAADSPLLAATIAGEQGVIFREGEPERDPTEAGLLADWGMTTSIAAPLRVGGVVWGTVWVARAGDPFDDVDLASITALSAILGGAVSRVIHLEELHQLAFTDPLTGLANRRALDDAAYRATSSLAAGRVRCLTALAIDVDGLKALNDSSGHAEGDRLLIATADLVKRVFAGVPDALVARTGGDEFVVLLPDAPLPGVLPVVERLCAAGRELAHGIGLSCGLASTSGTGPLDTPSSLLRAADDAQVRAKRLGGSRVVLG